MNDEPDTSELLTDLAHLGSAVGHHVINAYAAIVSNAEILRITAQSDSPADPVLLADMIIRTAVEAAGVARRLIDITRPVTQIGDERVALHELITQIAEERRPNGRAAVAWAVQADPVAPFRGNAAQLRAMIGHVTRNAEEAMGASGGTITLSTAMDGRGWVALEIADTGPGMPPEIHERAVEPFFSTRKGQMGVGLSIANGIWRRHRGTLAIKTVPGEGTRVRLCVDPVEGGLPLAR